MWLIITARKPKLGMAKLVFILIGQASGSIGRESENCEYYREIMVTGSSLKDGIYDRHILQNLIASSILSRVNDKPWDRASRLNPKGS